MMTLLAKATLKVLQGLDQPARLPSRDKPRGVALILALVTIVILSTAVVEFAYATRLNLVLASNERDSLKSLYLARSGVNLSRLLLAFQFGLQEESRGTDDEMGRLIGRAMTRSNFQMYQYIDLLMGPFNSGRVETPIGGISLTEAGIGGFGNFTGRFDVKVLPEEGRIDINQFARDEIRSGDLLQLCSMILDTQYDGIFEQKDKAGELIDRATMLQYIVDYVDINEEAIVLGGDCTIRGTGGDERRAYDRDDSHDVRPRNAMLTHVEELYQVHGMSEAFMRAFKDQLTVYGVGRPNLNVIGAPVFYSVLCQNVEGGQTGRAGDGQPAGSICATNPQVAQEIFWYALALDGIRSFFEDPISVLLAYVGSTESKLLPSARTGQPVAFLNVSQLPSYLNDLKQNPILMAQFLNYSPAYQRLASMNPAMMIDPVNPQFPQWTVEFNRAGLLRSVTAKTPSVYRIRSSGVYGTTESKIEAVIDFSKTLRRLPNEKALIGRETDPEELQAIRGMLREETERMPKGRVLYWREN
ncbi:MAG: general secretion pathway protein GspK [Bradymonadaceae bacterium]|nr:general secretion pathway protein GspK [Lujinxingiaceae bacterium]